MSGENEKIEKIKKSCNAAVTAARIMKIFCIAMAILTIGLGFGFIAFRDHINALFRQAEATGGFSPEEFSSTGIALFGSFYFEPRYFIDKEQFAEFLGIYMIVTGVVLVLLALVLHFVERVFTEIRSSDSPFRETVLKNMKIVFVLITLMVLQNSLGIGAVAGFSLWCVCRVFEYGCELQRLSDETL